MLSDAFAECLRSNLFRSLPSGFQFGLRDMARQVEQAPRFVLDRAALMMVHNLSETKYRNLVRALGVCRLPFPKMWVEFAFADRQAWLDERRRQGRHVSDNADASPPQRLGFLMEQVGTRIRVQLAWKHGEIPTEILERHYGEVVDAARRKELAGLVEVSKKAIEIETDPDLFEADQFERLMRTTAPEQLAEIIDEHGSLPEALAFSEFLARVEYVIPDNMKPFWQDIARQGKAALDQANQLARFDLANEWRFSLALLILLNSRNLIRMGEPVDVSALNKARAKKGKTPVLAHREITLSLSRIQKNRLGLLNPGRTIHKPGDPEFVMGHLKVRKTGVFWWSPHVRNAQDGVAPEIKVRNVTA